MIGWKNTSAQKQGCWRRKGPFQAQWSCLLLHPSWMVRSPRCTTKECPQGHQGRWPCLCLLQDSDEWRDRLSGGKRHVSMHIPSILKGTVVDSQDSSTDETCFYQCISIKLHTLGVHIMQGSSLNAGLGQGQRTFLTSSQMMAMPLVHRPQSE